jgi:hypothetical protein
MSKKGKYDEDYVLHGFANVTGHKGKSDFFWCEIFLVKGSMKPAKPEEHLTSANPENTSKDAGYVRAKKTQFEKAGALPKFGFAFSQKHFLEASYKVAYRISKQKKLHIIGDTLWKPCSLEMGRVDMRIETEEKTGNGFLIKLCDTL